MARRARRAPVPPGHESPGGGARKLASDLTGDPLPRLDFSGGIPPESRTLVVIPTMLTSAPNIEELIEALEVRFLANRDENLHFGLLTDFRDARRGDARGRAAVAAGPAEDRRAE